jgi:DNA-binding YbaB/EbfC family protein
MLKGLGDIMQAMKQAQAIHGRMGEMQAKLAEVRVEGSAGGGMVTVSADGQQRVLSCRIEPSLMETGDREMLEDLFCSAVNQALERAREAAATQMASLVDGFELPPGLKDAMSGLKFPGAH